MNNNRLIDFLPTAIAVINKDMMVVEANDAFKQRASINKKSKDINVIGTKCFNSAYKLSECCNSKTADSCPVTESFKTKKPSTTVHNIWVEDHAVVEEVIATPIIEKNGDVNFVVEEFRDLSQLLGLTKGIICTCAYCKKIRNEDGRWVAFEAYFQQHTGANFSHGICEECNEEVIGDFKKTHSCSH